MSAPHSLSSRLSHFFSRFGRSNTVDIDLLPVVSSPVSRSLRPSSPPFAHRPPRPSRASVLSAASRQSPPPSSSSSSASSSPSSPPSSAYPLSSSRPSRSAKVVPLCSARALDSGGLMLESSPQLPQPAPGLDIDGLPLHPFRKHRWIVAKPLPASMKLRDSLTDTFTFSPSSEEEEEEVREQQPQQAWEGSFHSTSPPSTPSSLSSATEFVVPGISSPQAATLGAALKLTLENMSPTPSPCTPVLRRRSVPRALVPPASPRGF